MSAYGVNLPQRVCQRCERPATVEVFNCPKNASVGFFCERDGAAEVERLDVAEEAYNLLHPRNKVP